MYMTKSDFMLIASFYTTYPVTISLKSINFACVRILRPAIHAYTTREKPDTTSQNVANTFSGTFY